MHRDNFSILLTLHNPPSHPHWSESVDWSCDRWDPMSNAPTGGHPILHVRGRGEAGEIFEPMHKANGDGDGRMPPFDGWFVPVKNGSGYTVVRPVEWQPLRAVEVSKSN